MIDIVNLSKVYGENDLKVEALKNINLKINKGSFVAIKGTSGCGKSTLLNIIGCLEHPTKGTIFIDGIDISKLNSNQLSKIRREKLGYVFQNFNLIPTMNALDNVCLPMMFSGEGKDAMLKRATMLLNEAKLGDRLKHKPKELSGGERQRVSIARALSNNPSIIIADEPTGNLDSKTGKIIMDIFIKLNKLGKTIILVTHDHNIAKKAEKILYIKDGKFVEEEGYEI